MSYSLATYTQELGLRKAKHLLRRASFSYSKDTLTSVSTMTASEALAFLSENNDDILEAPFEDLDNEYLNGVGEGAKRAFVTAWWWYNSVNQSTIKYKLSFFLFTSFTVSNGNGAGTAIYFYDYIRLLNYYAMGNLKTFAKKITLDNAMLRYLDNTDNNVENPNENYAREFLELFTILKGPQIGDGDYTHYTEHDVQQAARVFTGFKKHNDRTIIDPDTNIPTGYNNTNKHDSNDKEFSYAFNNHVISGQSTEEGMTQELNEFVDMVFDQEATAISYCRKLYRFFVKSEWDEEVESEIIIPLAQELILNDFELLPTVSTLLTSEHFFDEDNADNSDEIIGSIIKNPLQLLAEVINYFEIEIPNPITSQVNFYNNFFRKFVHNSFLGSAGMPFFSPDSVAGYPAHYQEPDFDRHWFSSTTIVSRYKLIESFIAGRDKIFPNALIMTQIDPVAFVENKIDTPNNIDEIVTEISNYLYPESIDESRKDYFIQVALDGYDEYYWTNSWIEYLNTGDDIVVRNRLNALLTVMINAAEFQIM